MTHKTLQLWPISKSYKKFTKLTFFRSCLTTSKRSSLTASTISTTETENNGKFILRAWATRWRSSWKNKRKYWKRWIWGKRKKNSRATLWLQSRNRPSHIKANRRKWRAIWCFTVRRPFWGIERSKRGWVRRKCRRNLTGTRKTISRTEMRERSRRR